MKYLRAVLGGLVFAALVWYAWDARQTQQAIAYNTKVNAIIADRMLMDYCMHMDSMTRRGYLACSVFRPQGQTAQ